MSLENLIEQHYGKDFSLKQLLEMIEGALSDTNVLKEDRPGERATAGAKEITITLPIIRLSEKMWGKKGTRDREILQNLLSKIIASGKNVQEKIKLLDAFLTEETIREDMTASEVLSYIVFLDTLTNILVHFNASAAGFTFEGFLAALLEGEQVPAGTAGIQDIIDNDKNPLSLKLLTESPGEVHGSYKDLISHFTDPSKLIPVVNDPETGKFIRNPNYLKQAGAGGQMKYIIALKNWREKDMGGNENEGGFLEGEIKFYEFNFSAQTFLEALASGPSKNHDLVLLPRTLSPEENGAEGEEFNPLNAPDSEEYTSLETTSKALYDKLVQILTPEAAQEIWDSTEIKQIGTWGGGARRGLPKLKIVQVGTDKLPSVAALSRAGADPRYRQIAKLGASEGYLSYGASAKLLKAALSMGEQEFWDLIKETKGVTGGVVQESSSRKDKETQFVVSAKYYQRDYEDGVGYLGAVKVGKNVVTALANKYAGVLNQKIFDIFAQLEQLADLLNSYFVGGDKESGLDAARAAGRIEKRTRSYEQEFGADEPKE